MKHYRVIAQKKSGRVYVAYYDTYESAYLFLVRTMNRARRYTWIDLQELEDNVYQSVNNLGLDVNLKELK